MIATLASLIPGVSQDPRFRLRLGGRCDLLDAGGGARSEQPGGQARRGELSRGHKHRPAGQRDPLELDSKGRVLDEWNGTGALTQTGRNSNGWVTSETDPAGQHHHLRAGQRRLRHAADQPRRQHRRRRLTTAATTTT